MTIYSHVAPSTCRHTKDYLWTVFPIVLLWNSWTYSKAVGECQKVSFWEVIKNHVFFRSAFQSTLLKHAGEVFFVLRNADFFKLKNVSELSWGKVLLIRVLYREQIMRHGWSVTLTCCYMLYSLFAFYNRHAVLRKQAGCKAGYTTEQFEWQNNRSRALPRPEK